MAASPAFRGPADEFVDVSCAAFDEVREESALEHRALYEQYVTLVGSRLEAGVKAQMQEGFSWEDFLKELPATVAAAAKRVAEAAERGATEEENHEAEAEAEKETKDEDGGGGDPTEDDITTSLGKITLEGRVEKKKTNRDDDDEDREEKKQPGDDAESFADPLELLMAFTEFKSFKKLMQVRKQTRVAEARAVSEDDAASSSASSSASAAAAAADAKTLTRKKPHENKNTLEEELGDLVRLLETGEWTEVKVKDAAAARGVSCARACNKNGVDVVKLRIDGANLTAEDCVDMLFSTAPDRSCWDATAKWEKLEKSEKETKKDALGAGDVDGDCGAQKYTLTYKVPMLPMFKMDVQAGAGTC